MERVARGGCDVDAPLAAFVDDELVPAIGVDGGGFWHALEVLVEEFMPRRQQLLAVRDELQRRIDEWHRSTPGTPEPAAYEHFLTEIGYLRPEPTPFTITTTGVDDEIATVAGPQLVVPADNARYALNAANARWGSLYDALYGTDALGDAPTSGPYDPERGRRVVAWAASLLDSAVPLADGGHGDAVEYADEAGELVVELADGRTTRLADPGQYEGRRSDDTPTTTTLLLRHHGLGIRLVIDRASPIGSSHAAGICDVILESAITTIVDFEDSVAAVDGTDKVNCYRNWLGLMTGTLHAAVTKDGSTFERTLAGDDTFVRGATTTVVPGRALLLVRVVGHLMTTPAVRDRHGNAIGEGLLDTVIAVCAALADGRAGGSENSRHGSIYVVQPKLHGADEVRLVTDVFDRLESWLGLAENTIKIGIMDEERRTTLNLAACIRAAADRVVFVNTGFLDRTGDEIHTSMEAGPVIPKTEMKGTRWLSSYEQHNVEVALAAGFPGRAQIGKGMWAAPDAMAAMLSAKGDHPHAGATCAWVPSPTAATLHATHYHHVEVAARHASLADRLSGDEARQRRSDLLTVALLGDRRLDPDTIIRELDNNAQGICGYVVRWVHHGVGCSKVPDIDDVNLMEDRATCRISSQHIANWLRHGLVGRDDVTRAFERMAHVVNRQNADDPDYRPLTPDSPAFAAALELVLTGTRQPSGYTEPILHRYRAHAKRARDLAGST